MQAFCDVLWSKLVGSGARAVVFSGSKSAKISKTPKKCRFAVQRLEIDPISVRPTCCIIKGIKNAVFPVGSRRYVDTAVPNNKILGCLFLDVRHGGQLHGWGGAVYAPLHSLCICHNDGTSVFAHSIKMVFFSPWRKAKAKILLPFYLACVSPATLCR